jgi:uncharacterized OB-fold protein
MAEEAKPQPVEDDESAPFWAACREGRLLLQRCGACGKAVFYPRSICPHCHADALGPETGSGRGTIHSWTVSRRPAGPGWADEVPYVVALVDLEEGPRLLGVVEVDDPDEVRTGLAVEADFRGDDGPTALRWRLRQP